ncbi:hypothetical protein B7494_g3940 [Chlorociboria aeruginascens]|nr:hypothetical protein B7494_g3940 [Chlorociboria aeruginascens]
MLPITRARALRALPRTFQIPARRNYANDLTPKKQDDSTALPTGDEQKISLQETPEEKVKFQTLQAPNRKEVWSRNQKPRAQAMTGPRFEQTIMKYQPSPQAAIELIHKQPVRWTHERVVECDGGGGPLGHPRIFINTDKPQICMCTYCGLPFANEHHRAHLESLPDTSYPLKTTGDAAEIPQSQRITDEALGQR